MKFYFVVVVIVLVIYQVGCVGPNQIPAPQQSPCVIGQQPLQQVPLVQAQPQPPHVLQQWSQQPCNALQPPPYVIGQQPSSQQIPPIPVQQQVLPQVPFYPVQQLQHNYVSQPLPQQPWPQQPCNTLQQPPFNPQIPQNPVMTIPPQPGANHLEQQNMLPQSYPPQYPQPYPPPPGYPQQPGAYPGGYYPPVPGAYPGGCYPPVPGAYPGVNPAYPANPAGSSCPIPSGQQLPCPVDPKPKKPSTKIPRIHKRRNLVWCTCPTCKDVVPIILKGNKTIQAGFVLLEDPNEEDIRPFSERIEDCDRPKVDIALCNHRPPCNINCKIFHPFQ